MTAPTDQKKRWVMAGNDDGPQFGPVLRRISLLVVVLTAIPVMLWVITSVVRDYLGPPSLAHFRQLSSAKNTAAVPVAEDRDDGPSDTDSNPTTVEARASMSDARSHPAGDDHDESAPKGPFLGERTPAAPVAAPATVASIDQGSLHEAARDAAQRAAMLPGGSRISPASAAPAIAPSSAPPPATSAPATTTMLTSAPTTATPMTAAPTTAAPTTAAPTTAAPMAAAPVRASAQPPVPPWPQPSQLPPPMPPVMAQQPLQRQAAIPAQDDRQELPASPPLSGKIPLPRKRPHIDGHLAQAATPSSAPSTPATIPIPRPRPSAAGAAAAPTADNDNAASPLNFLQNLLH